MLSDWLQRRREARLRLRYEAGFDYAAGQLLRGVPLQTLEAQSACEFTSDVFDKGMKAAIAAHRGHR